MTIINFIFIILFKPIYGFSQQLACSGNAGTPANTPGVVRMVHFVYKTFFSEHDVPQACRFQPSCADFSKEAFARFPWHKALWLTADRITRCHGKQRHEDYATNAANGLFLDPPSDYE